MAKNTLPARGVSERDAFGPNARRAADPISPQCTMRLYSGAMVVVAFAYSAKVDALIRRILMRGVQKFKTSDGSRSWCSAHPATRPARESSELPRRGRG